MLLILYNKNIWIAANDTKPDNPKKPDTITVNKLMGICRPIDPPKTLKKNKNRTPIPNFTVLCAIKRVGLTGAPINNSKTINETIIVITSVELNFSTPFSSFLFSTYD